MLPNWISIMRWYQPSFVKRKDAALCYSDNNCIIMKSFRLADFLFHCFKYSVNYRIEINTECCFVTQSWWRHQMETFSALLALCVGNSPVTGKFPLTKASDAEPWCFLGSRVNNRDAGDLRRHRGHNDVTSLMMLLFCNVYNDTCS